MDDLVREFEQTLERGSLYPLYQPAVSLDDYGIVGYCAFLRGPADSLLHTPNNLFAVARVGGKRYQLEKTAVQTMLTYFVRLKLPGILCLGLTNEFLLERRSSRLLKWLDKAGFDPQRLVVEVFGNRYEEDQQQAVAAAQRCRELGLGLSLTEFTAINMTRKQLKTVRPDFIKIDRRHIENIEESLEKQRFVDQLLAGLPSRLQVVAQGVASEESYFTLRRLGVDFAQGGYFAPPQSYPTVEIPKSRFFPSRGGGPSIYDSEADTVGMLSRAVSHIEPTDRTGDVLKLFVQSPSLQSMPVIYQREPVGMIRREHLANIFLTPYGRDLFGKSPIINFMDHDPLVVEAEIPIREVSRLIVERGRAEDNQDFIISRAGHYFGMGKVVDVLKRITEMQIRDASHANPLTGLPGNVRIDSAIRALLLAKEPFVAGYLDLDNFKPFNDHYGYECGDQAIRFVAQLAVEAADPECDFVGHVGGDDFIMLFRSADWKARCERILERFAGGASDFYNESDRERGGILAKDRRGNEVFFPMLSLSIGVVKPEKCRSHHCVAAMAAEAKKQAKRSSGNALFVERRKGDER